MFPIRPTYTNKGWLPSDYSYSSKWWNWTRRTSMRRLLGVSSLVLWITSAVLNRWLNSSAHTSDLVVVLAVGSMVVATQFMSILDQSTYGVMAKRRRHLDEWQLELRRRSSAIAHGVTVALLLLLGVITLPPDISSSLKTAVLDSLMPLALVVFTLPRTVAAFLYPNDERDELADVSTQADK